MSSNQFELSDPPSDAISSVQFSPHSPTKLLISSWDRHVYLYDIEGGEGGRLIRKFEHKAPILDVCWGTDEHEAYTAGLDWDVGRIDLDSGELGIMSSHTAGVKSVLYHPQSKLLISASWDSTLHLHVPSDPEHTPNTIQLPHKPFSISASSTKLVVAMANRAVNIYDLKTLPMLVQSSNNPPPNHLEVQPFQTRESSLKFMTRCVSTMPNDAGYASSSIEGRVAVEWFDPSAESQARKYAFKCHRVQQDGIDVVYPVNALAFHPVHGTFASGGGDGVVALWDGVAKRRIRQYQKYLASIASLAFSSDGKFLAVAVSPGFEDGKEDLEEGAVKVFMRELSSSEAKGKSAK